MRGSNEDTGVAGRSGGATAETSPDPAALIRSCLDQAPGAWDAFFRQYKGLIYSTIRRYQLPEDEAKEAFQGSMVAIYRQLPRLRDHARLHTWIVSIACRQSIDQIRARSRSGRGDPASDTRVDELASLASETLPDEAMVELLDAQRAREALSAASDRCRKLLSALFFQDPPEDYKSIATREGIQVSSVGALRGRCLGAMRRFFESRGWTA